jgi:hypothetical protein
VKLAQIEPYLNRDQSVAVVATHYGEPVVWAQIQVAQLQAAEAQAGF